MLRTLLRFIGLTLILASCTTTQAPSLAGDWAGTLQAAGESLRLIFHITESDSGYSATIESVDQGGAIVPLTMEVDGSSIVFSFDQLALKYAATASGNQIIGEFSQGGISVPDFVLKRTE